MLNTIEIIVVSSCAYVKQRREKANKIYRKKMKQKWILFQSKEIYVDVVENMTVVTNSKVSLSLLVSVCVCVCFGVCACMRACVCACVCICLCACVCGHVHMLCPLLYVRCHSNLLIPFVH